VKPQDGSPRSRFRRPLRRPLRAVSHGFWKSLSPPIPRARPVRPESVRPNQGPVKNSGNTVLRRTNGAGGESSLTTLPQSSLPQSQRGDRGDNRSRCRGRRPTHVDYDPFDPIRQAIERAAPPCVSAVTHGTPLEGPPSLREDRRDGENLWGAFPQPTRKRAPQVSLSPLHSIPRLLNRTPRQRAMLTKNRVFLAPSHRASPRSRSQDRPRRPADLSLACGLPKERRGSLRPPAIPLRTGQPDTGHPKKRALRVTRMGALGRRRRFRSLLVAEPIR
jgi:hypothetical protein